MKEDISFPNFVDGFNPRIVSKVTDMMMDGKIQQCGIWAWNVMLAMSLREGIPIDQLPLSYEEKYGDPGMSGITLSGALDFLDSLEY